MYTSQSPPRLEIRLQFRCRILLEKFRLIGTLCMWREILWQDHLVPSMRFIRSRRLLGRRSFARPPTHGRRSS